jgi:hypothetical protein
MTLPVTQSTDYDYLQHRFRMGSYGRVNIVVMFTVRSEERPAQTVKMTLQAIYVAPRSGTTVFEGLRRYQDGSTELALFPVENLTDLTIVRDDATDDALRDLYSLNVIMDGGKPVKFRYTTADGKKTNIARVHPLHLMDSTEPGKTLLVGMVERKDGAFLRRTFRTDRMTGLRPAGFKSGGSSVSEHGTFRDSNGSTYRPPFTTTGQPAAPGTPPAPQKQTQRFTHPAPTKEQVEQARANMSRGTTQAEFNFPDLDTRGPRRVTRKPQQPVTQAQAPTPRVPVTGRPRRVPGPRMGAQGYSPAE